MRSTVHSRVLDDAEIGAMLRRTRLGYHRAVAALFHERGDPLEVLKWKDVYEKLEAAIDRCENVANIIEGVIIKHS